MVYLRNIEESLDSSLETVYIGLGVKGSFNFSVWGVSPATSSSSD